MRIGMVCPYSFDVAGGVQFHVRDLAEQYIMAGHAVSVMAPADEDTDVPPYLESGGRAIPVRYNGSVARLSFGPGPAARVRRWLEQGDFDIVHIHEPMVPSLSLLALWAAHVPIVATFHSSQTRSRAMQLAFPMMRSTLEKISARIAVSEDARRTLVDHLGGDAVVIPNGVSVEFFARARPRPEWAWTAEAPTFAFLGRIDEPRKGLDVFLAAVPLVLSRFPKARFIVAGSGDIEAARKDANEAVEFLGPISDDDKAALLSSVYAYVAPQTGGESFGIVLVEAMSAGTLVVASDLGAFRRVLEEGTYGRLFSVGSGSALGQILLASLDEPMSRAQTIAAASVGVQRYDWSTVSERIMMVYETAIGAAR